MPKKLLKATLWIAIICFTGLMLIYKPSLRITSLKTIFGYAGQAVSLTGILLALYTKWLWRINPVDKTPRFKSNYHVIMTSSYDGKDYDGEIKIRQNLLSVHVTLITNESQSASISSTIVTRDAVPTLVYSYCNLPNTDLRYRSPIHYGTVKLELNDMNHLIGEYYTDRKTYGTIRWH